MNVAEKKALLKNYLGKIISNKVVYINGNVIRANNLTWIMCQDINELDLGDVKVTIKPMTYDFKIVQSSVTLKVYEDGKVTLNIMVPFYVDEKTLNFVSQLTNNQLKKLISALEPIIFEINREVSLIDEEANALELVERNNLIKNIKKNIQSKMKFDKLTTSELKQLNKLVEKALVKKRL